MNDFVPAARPEITLKEAIALAGQPEDKLFILGRRGYYRDSMGVTGHNDRNIYDDAICLVTPTRCVPYNANTDPSKLEQNRATLQPGRWLYTLGMHRNSYEALVQAGNVVVFREGTKDQYTKNEYLSGLGLHLGGGLWKGQFGINIHRGGEFTSTGSEGCQTIFAPQWGDFIEKVKSAMAYYNVKAIPYILTAREES